MMKKIVRLVCFILSLTFLVGCTTNNEYVFNLSTDDSVKITMETPNDYVLSKTGDSDFSISYKNKSVLPDDSDAVVCGSFISSESVSMYTSLAENQSNNYEEVKVGCNDCVIYTFDDEVDCIISINNSNHGVFIGSKLDDFSSLYDVIGKLKITVK